MSRLFFLVFASIVLAGAAPASVPGDPSAVLPLAQGDALPTAHVTTAAGERVALADLVAGRPVAVVFYRGGWCPYCNEHLADLAEAAPRLREKGYRIFAVSPDRPELVAEAAVESTHGHRLLSDSLMEAAQAFGVAFRVDDETFARLQGFGIDLDASSGEAHRMLPVPAVFLLDAEGTIVFRYYNSNYRERLSGDELLEAAAMSF